MARRSSLPERAVSSSVVGDSVTELSASTGALVQVISGSSYGFESPLAISSVATDVWVTNSYVHSVTELNAWTGALVRVISGSSYKFKDPEAIKSSSCGLDGPDGVSSDGSDGGSRTAMVNQ
jgi:hypothetical protein